MRKEEIAARIVAYAQSLLKPIGGDPKGVWHDGQKKIIQAVCKALDAVVVMNILSADELMAHYKELKEYTITYEKQ